jgi:hypothetical protein
MEGGVDSQLEAARQQLSAACAHPLLAATFDNLMQLFTAALLLDAQVRVFVLVMWCITSGLVYNIGAGHVYRMPPRRVPGVLMPRQGCTAIPSPGARRPRQAPAVL